jgi:hypothetical protein
MSFAGGGLPFILESGIDRRNCDDAEERIRRAGKESDEYGNQWNRADGSALGDGLLGRPRTVERRNGRSRKEGRGTKRNELSESNRIRKSLKAAEGQRRLKNLEERGRGLKKVEEI